MDKKKPLIFSGLVLPRGLEPLRLIFNFPTINYCNYQLIINNLLTTQLNVLSL